MSHEVSRRGDVGLYGLYMTVQFSATRVYPSFGHWLGHAGNTEVFNGTLLVENMAFHFLAVRHLKVFSPSPSLNCDTCEVEMKVIHYSRVVGLVELLRIKLRIVSQEMFSITLEYI